MEQQTEMVQDQQPSVIEVKPQSLEDVQAELEKTRQALKKANSESASHRHKAKELEDYKTKIEADKLSESEKLQAQLAEKEQLLLKQQERVIRSEIKSAASTLGVINPTTAAKLIDWSQIEFDDDGDPTNVEDLLKELIKNEPYLVGKPQNVSIRTSATNPSRSSVDGNDYFEQLADKAIKGTLDPKHYAALSVAEKQKLIETMTKKRR